MREFILSLGSSLNSALDFIWAAPTLLWVVIAVIVVFSFVNVLWSKI